MNAQNTLNAALNEAWSVLRDGLSLSFLSPEAAKQIRQAAPEAIAAVGYTAVQVAERVRNYTGPHMNSAEADAAIALVWQSRDFAAHLGRMAGPQ